MQRIQANAQVESGWPDGACTLDHDGCVVCSDAGIPLRVVALDGDDALCEDATGHRTSIAIELVALVTTGEILLTHGGVAIGRGTVAGLGPDGGENSYEVCQ